MNPQEITQLWQRIIGIENALGLKPGLNEPNRLEKIVMAIEKLVKKDAQNDIEYASLASDVADIESKIKRLNFDVTALTKTIEIKQTSTPLPIDKVSPAFDPNSTAGGHNQEPSVTQNQKPYIKTSATFRWPLSKWSHKR